MKQLLITIAALVLVGCGESSSELLIQSVREGNIEAVKQHLAAGADVNVKDARGMTPLHLATSNGQKEIAELLIAKDADVNAKMNNGMTPLDATSVIPPSSNKTEIIDLLRKHGGKTGEELKAAEPVVQAAKPEPPTAKAPEISIHEAAREGNIEAVKQRLAAGTDVDAKNNDEWTALHVAAGEGQKEITELLIAKGADVNANTPDGLTVFFAAILGANKEIIELLIAKGADVNVRGFGGMTPLNMADDEGEKEIADLLRKHGAKTSDWLKAGESIHIAAKAGHIEAIKKHLAAGADVNAKSGPFGLTPLHFATWRSNKETMEFLIDNGADVNAKRNDGAIALHYAVWFGLKGKTEFLLSKGSDVKARDGDNDGATPLHEAVMRSPNNGIIELLVANEADVNDMDDSGKTPLDWAIKYKRNKTADLLRKHGGKTGEELKAEGK